LLEKVKELTRKPLLAVLATVYPSGGPQAFPVWYEYDGTHFLVITSAGAVKVRNIRRNPRVALCITDTSRMGDTVTVFGRAEIVEDDRAAREVQWRLAVRYLGPREGRRWYDTAGEGEMVIIRITAEKFL
jgi:PPOX class probable F420-dependent enzyme